MACGADNAAAVAGTADFHERAFREGAGLTREKVSRSADGVADVLLRTYP